uniref:hypothetical protein n=1 Tax=Serratia marcescens TaxID=615 RepID=UPI001C375E26
SYCDKKTYRNGAICMIKIGFRTTRATMVMRGGPVDKPAALARLPRRATLANGTGQDSSVVRDQ